MKVTVFTFMCLKESEIQLGPRDRGDDSRVLLLGLHSYSDSGRVYLFKTGCKQVKTTNKDYEWSIQNAQSNFLLVTPLLFLFIEMVVQGFFLSVM